MRRVIFNTLPQPQTSIPYETLEEDTQQRSEEKKKVLEMIPWRAVVVVLSLICLLNIVAVSINRHKLDGLNEVI